MKGVTPEDIEKARQMDLLTYLRYYEPRELVHVSGQTYSTRTHDSLRINNGAWMWFSRGIGGWTALDYLIKVKEMGFIEAVNTINGQEVRNESPVFYCPKEKKKKLLLPEKASNNDRITQYLFDRGIDIGVIRYCIKEGLIYESEPYNNVIFLGYDNEKIPRYAAYRATSKKRIMGDAAGSDKRYSFNIMGKGSDTIHVFESAIDLLSYATLVNMKGGEWKKENYISMAGVYAPRHDGPGKVPAALQRVLSENRDISTVYLHFDRDRAGLNAARSLTKALQDRYRVIDEPPESGKDFNDHLRFEKHIFRSKDKEKEKSYER